MTELKLDQTVENTPLSVLSKQKDNNALGNTSLNRIKYKISRDSFEGNIKEAFDIYNLFQCLAEGVPSMSYLKKKDSFTFDQWKVLEFLR